MASEFSYKLGSYKITEVVGGGLVWESHHGLGSSQKGKCFIEGRILVLGPVDTEESGFLKREFQDHLDKLPKWDKTEYYCLSHSILKCSTGARIFTENSMKDRVAATPKATNVATNDSVEYKRTMNKQLESKKESVKSKEIISELWDISKNCLIAVHGVFFNILKKISSKYRG